jgi:hypothetical protein
MPMPAVVSALQDAEDEISAALIYRRDHPGLIERFHGVTEYEKSVINQISGFEVFLSALRVATVQTVQG